MRKITYVLLIFIIVFIILIPLLYFFQNICEDNYISNLMGNWLATLIGVIIGIPIALQIHRIQQQKQLKIEKENKLQEEKKKIKVYLNRIYNEILDNIDQFKELRNVMNESKSSRMDIWRWANTVVDTFSFFAYNDYQK